MLISSGSVGMSVHNFFETSWKSPERLYKCLE